MDADTDDDGGYFGIAKVMHDAAATAHAQDMSGIDQDLQDAATRALNAHQQLFDGSEVAWTPGDDGRVEPHPLFKQQADDSRAGILQRFRTFSSADLPSLQTAINQLGHVWHELWAGAVGDKDESKLLRAKELLANWKGVTAEKAKTQITLLTGDFDEMKLAISEVQSIVIGARDAVAGARKDLISLTDAFESAATQYHKEKEIQAAEDNAAMLKVVADGFTTALTSLLDPKDMLAKGVEFAGRTAGAAIDADLATKKRQIMGDNPPAIVNTYLGHIDEVVKDMPNRMNDLVNKIRAIELPQLAPSPDPSPGSTFEPTTFRPSDVSEEDADKYRKPGRDIPDPGADRRSRPAPPPSDRRSDDRKENR